MNTVSIIRHRRDDWDQRGQVDALHGRRAAHVEEKPLAVREEDGQAVRPLSLNEPCRFDCGATTSRNPHQR